MRNVIIRTPTEVESRTIAGITFTTAEISEINADLDRLAVEEAREQAELEWFELMDSTN